MCSVSEISSLLDSSCPADTDRPLSACSLQLGSLTGLPLREPGESMSPTLRGPSSDSTDHTGGKLFGLAASLAAVRASPLSEAVVSMLPAVVFVLPLGSRGAARHVVLWNASTVSF